MSDWHDDNDDSSTRLGFNVEDVQAPSFDLLPPGRYQVVCSSAKVAPSKNNPSTVLANIEETIILDGDHAGRKIWSRYVVAHADGKVMARGRADVVRMMSAYGIGGGDLAPCVGRECMAAVDIEAAKGEWDARNKIKRREAIGGAMPAAKPAPVAAASKAAPPSFLRNRKTIEG
jgi:hypothetical protein